MPLRTNRSLAGAALCCALVVSPAVAGAQHAVEQAMARALAEEGLVGAVWSTVAPGRAPVLGAAGLRHAGRPEPLRLTDRVQVGSVTKTLVATGILRVVTEGRTTLDTPVAALLPTLRVHNPWHATHPLRLRHLLDHTSGLDDARLWQLFNSAPTPATPLAAGFYPRRLRLEVRYPPGERFSYSNTGYGLLGVVIESLTRQRYETYLDAQLLRPLGMANSTFQFATQVGTHADPRLAMGHFEKGVSAPAVPTYLRPAMQFTTTAEDMARFARFLMSDGTIAGVPFIDPALLRAMGTPVGTEAARAGLAVGYGLGMSTRDRHGVVGRCHAGNTVGYRAMLCLHPERGTAFFVSMNADNEDANYLRLDSIVLASLALDRDVEATPRPLTRDAGAWAGVYVPRPARFEMLSYLEHLTGFVRAAPDGDRFVLRPFMAAPVVLEPMGEVLLRARGRTIASHALVRTASGERAISNGLQTLGRVGVWRIALLWASFAAGVVGTVWVLVRGIALLVRRGRARDAAVFAPAVVLLALLAACALLVRQSVLALGDRSAVNFALALLTGLLPVAAAMGLWKVTRTPERCWAQRVDAAAMLGIAQWTGMLAWWGLLPLRLWA